jgi:hypothetical protein
MKKEIADFPKELEPLIKEVRKYKSAEEFVRERYSLPLHRVKTVKDLEEALNNMIRKNIILAKMWGIKYIPLSKWEKNIKTDLDLYKKAKIYSLIDFFNQVKRKFKKSSLKGERIIWRTKYSL